MRQSWMNHIKAKVSDIGTDIANIAFFNNDSWTTTNSANYYISGVSVGAKVNTWIESDIPDDCKYIIVSYRQVLSQNVEIKVSGDFLSNLYDFDILKFNPHNEYFPKIANAKTGLLEARTNSILMLAHYSDIHGAKNNLEQILRFCDNYHSYVDDILDTGDTIADSFNLSDWSWFSSIKGSNKIIRCIGNHENAEKTGYSYDFFAHNESECYQKYFANDIADWGVTYEENKCYYYKDYTNKNVRLIVLDCMHDSTEQNQWFVSVLEDARVKGLHVVAANHSPYNVNPFDTRFHTKVPSLYLWKDVWGNAVNDFIGNGGNFVCWLAGHTHCDAVGTMTGNFTRQIMIVIDTAQV